MIELVHEVEHKLKTNSLQLAKEIGIVDKTYTELLNDNDINQQTTLGVVRLIAISSQNKELKNTAKVVLHEIAKRPPKEIYLKQVEVIDNINANN